MINTNHFISCTYNSTVLLVGIKNYLEKNLTNIVVEKRPFTWYITIKRFKEFVAQSTRATLN